MAGWRKCVFGCRGTVMYKFPSDATLRQKWNDFCDIMTPKNAFLCARHFTDESFMNKELYESGRITRLSLRSDAVPAIKDVDPRFTPDWWTEKPVLNRDKKSVGTQLSAGTLRSHRSKGVQASDRSISRDREQPLKRRASISVIVSNCEQEESPAKRVKVEEEQQDISVPHNSMYEVRDSDASDQSDLESEYGDAKYIISVSSLRELFEKCPVCTKHCRVQRRRRGLLLCFTQSCPHCCYRRRWESQVEELLEVPVTEDHSEHGLSEDHSEHGLSEDHSEHGLSEDHSEHGLSEDHSEHGLSEDHSEHGLSEDHSEHGLSEDHSEHGLSEDHSEHGLSEDHSEHGLSKEDMLATHMFINQQGSYQDQDQSEQSNAEDWL